MTMDAMDTHREPEHALPARLESTLGSAPALEGELAHGALGCPSRDELAQQDICAALLSTPGLDARHIEVEMTGAGVLLRGAVASPDDRARALWIARRIAAPRPVRDVLTLLPSGSRLASFNEVCE